MINQVNATTHVASPVVNESETKEILFNKYVIRNGQEIPENLDLQGCFVISRDEKKYDIIHKLFYVVQKIHAFIFRKNIDPYLCHGMIFMNRDQKKEGNMIMAHGVFDGIVTSSRNYLKDKNVTELVVYQPVDKKMRQLIKEHAQQTALCRKDDAADKKKISFSFVDMARSVFKSPNRHQTKNSMKRLAYATADLMQKRQILDVKGKKPQSFFCVPYALTVLQGSHLADELNGKVDTSKSRDELAAEILEGLEETNSFKYSFMKLDARFTMSGYSAESLDKNSQEIKL